MTFEDKGHRTLSIYIVGTYVHTTRPTSRRLVGEGLGLELCENEGGRRPFGDSRDDLFVMT